MNSGPYNSSQMAWAQSLQNAARITRLEILVQALCYKAGIKVDQIPYPEEPDPQLMECIRLMDECVEEVKASGGHQEPDSKEQRPDEPCQP